MLRAAVRREIHRVAMPHGKRIAVIRVRKLLLENVILEVVDINVLREPAGVALPGTKIAEDAVVSDLGAICVKRSEPALVHGQRLGQAAIHRDGNWRLIQPLEASRRDRNTMRLLSGVHATTWL